MSVQLIQQYHAKVEQLIRYSGSHNEGALRKPFQDLLEQYAAGRHLLLVPELEYIRRNLRVRPDGTLKDPLRQDWGFWESKDEKDDLDEEIKTKIAKGYPTSNILFQDQHTAVLYQGGKEVLRTPLGDAPALDVLLTRFVSYESEDLRQFHTAIDQFEVDVPALAEELRAIIDEQHKANAAFRQALSEFLELCQKAINPRIEIADAREMLIQHILTEDIFMTVFDDPQFHRENVIARKLQEVIATFYHGAVQRAIHARIGPFYETINARASQIYNHMEKQKFLKALYESFYRAYNPKAADRLGIIYTPDEIVHFMVEAADHLVFKHFGKTLGDKGVEILDPATGTATFITEVIDYLQLSQLTYKYQHEIHCNEVAILPYYIANLNIEYTYKQKTGQYLPFDNICFVDTLDNMGFAGAAKQTQMHFGLTDENMERIQRQNERKISVIIGNPPYNANQMNENENNKNRDYPEIDARIKQTYIKSSTAQKTKVYDMYARFYRWASDRIDENGIVAFITNSSFLDSRTFDGFRKMVADEFSHIYIVDLGGNVRNNPELSGTTNNVFGIQTGVAIAFMVKKKSDQGACRIGYARRPEMERASEKLAFLRTTRFSEIEFEVTHPDERFNWLHLTESSWDDLIPIGNKKTKEDSSTTAVHSSAIFKMFSLGVVTNRDEWVYDDDRQALERKVRFLIDAYNDQVDRHPSKTDRADLLDELGQDIKWTRAVKRDFVNGIKYAFQPNLLAEGLYRPYVKRNVYFSSELNEMQNLMPRFFHESNVAILFSGPNSPKPFVVLSTTVVPDLNCLSAAADGCRVMPLHNFSPAGERIDNITDWALAQFRARYQTPEVFETSGVSQQATSQQAITKLDIFHYVYAVLHHPAYRRTYEQNLKREFPRIPFYDDFRQWAEWGRQLMELHLGYEQAAPYPLVREDKAPGPTPPRPRLVAQREIASIAVDTVTTLRGLPPEVWDYRLGTYTALGWVLERYKERTPKDPTIREKFNTYRFAEYKEQVIDLLRRVTTVSVETMRIIKQMP